MAIIKTEQSNKFNPRHSNTIPSRDIERKFGKKEDFVELHIYDLNGKRLQSFNNFKRFTLPNNTNGELTSELNFDFEDILQRAGYRTGIYNVHVNIQRRKIFDLRRKVFRIKEISSSRTELKVITTRPNDELDLNSAQFIKDVRNSPLFRDFNLNFGKDVNILGINIDIDRSDINQYVLLVKLFKPLPRSIEVDDPFNFTEELVSPVITTVDLGQPMPIDRSVDIQGPNFRIDTRLNSSIPTAYKSYDDILSTSTTSSYQKLLSRLDGYEVPEIDYSYIRPLDSSSVELGENAPSHFENFVHFGSATERLKNFEYKVKLIEAYNQELKQVRTITGDTSQTATVLTVTSSIELKKENLIQGFDGYERFLYFESGAFSWPKTEGAGTEESPYLLAHSTSSEALNWLGSPVFESPYYGGQLNSASIYDNTNPNSLIQLIPNHVGDKIDNEPYLLFCNMIGNFFDPIWAHMKEITQIRDNSHIYGVSKDLVYYALKSLGIEAYDQFENQDLINYIFGDEYTTTDIATVITGSASSSLSRGDITKEIWKRLYHNAPYLLKSKGTARGLQALISCYGIPNTILNVKEYIGSNPIREDKNLFEHNKYQKALNANSEDYQGFFIETEWSSSNALELSASRKTVEFRINPHRHQKGSITGSQYHLFSLSGSVSSSDLHLILSPWSGSEDFYDDGDKLNFGRLDLFQFTSSIATSSYFPAYNGRFWNVFIGTDGITGSNPTVNFGAYQANHLKEVDFVTSSVSITERENAEAFGNPLFTGELGQELMIDGTLDDAANFTAQTGFAVSSGVATYSGGGTNSKLRSSNLNVVDGRTYQVVFDLTDTDGGGVFVRISGGSFTSVITGTATHTVQVVAGSSSPKLDFEAGDDSKTFTLDNISVKEVTLETYHSHGAKQTFFGGIKNLVLDGVQQTSNYFIDYDTIPANTSSLFDLEYSGSLSEVRIYFGELLSHNTLKDHALDPLMYAGNATTSSYETLISRFPLSFELEKTVDNEESIIPSSSFDWNQLPTASADQNQAFLDANAPITGGAILDATGNVSAVGGEPIFTVAGTPLLQSHHPNEGTTFLRAFTYMNANQLSGFEETHFQLAPNTVGRSAANNKIRIDSGSVKDGILSTTVLSQTPTRERQPNDFEDVGVFFSPQHELNEDIIYTIGHFSMDDNIGDPRHQTSSFYPDLSTLKNNYFQKIPSGQGRLNTFDFIRLIQFTDHTLFELIKQFTPQKANLKTGLLIEPHYLERNKFQRFHPIISSSLYEAHLKDIDKELTGSFVKNNNISQLDNTTGSAVLSYKESNYNTTIDVIKAISGSNPWEQGPINPKIHFQLDFSDKPDGYNIDNGGIGGLSTTYGVAGGPRTIEQNRLKIFKPQGQINNGAVTRDFGVNVGKQYIFSCDTTENPGNVVVYHGSTKNNTDESLTGGYNNNPNVTGSRTTRKDVNLDTPANIITGTSVSSNTVATGSIRFEFGATEPFQRIYFRANANSGDAGTTFFSNIQVVEKNLNERVSSGSNELRPHVLIPYGNYMTSTISKKVNKNLFENRGKELLADPTLETGNDWNVSNSGGTTPGDGTGTYTFDDDGNYSQLSTGTGIIELGKRYELTITVDSISAGTKIKLNQTGFHDATPPGETGTFTTFFQGTTINGTTTPRTNLVLYHSPYSGVTNGAVISFVSLKEVNPLEKVEFDDSLLDLSGWKRSRYDGSKLTGAKINEYAEGDITYGKNPVIDKESTNIYFCTKLTAGENEDDKLCKIKNHSYITIHSIISIDEETDRVEIIDKDSVSYNSFQTFLSSDLYEGAPFSLKLLDPGAPSQLKKTYHSKFHQGYLYRTVEHKGKDGTGNIAGEGIQAGRIHSASSTFPSSYFSSSGINVFSYGQHNNTINESTIELVSNPLTREIFPNTDSFGMVNFDTSSQDFYYDTMENLSSFYNSMLIPIASESKKDLYVTFNKGQRLAMADYEVSGSLAGIQSISTAQLDLENYIVTSSNHTQITASGAMKGFGKDLVEPHHYLIPIMQGPHDLIMNKKSGASITWPATGGSLSGNNEGTEYTLKYYFSGNTNTKALYQISYVEKAPVIIADVVKTEDLTNGIGEKGFIIIPDNLNKDIKKNIDFYLDQTGLIETGGIEKAPKQGK